MYQRYNHLFATDLQIEEDNCKVRAIAAQQQAAMVAASKDTTVNDLTRGSVNYKYLGLDFQKADHDRLKYVSGCLSDCLSWCKKYRSHNQRHKPP